MRLSRSPAFMVARAEELPTRDALMAKQKDARYGGGAAASSNRGGGIPRPVLFAPDAADDIVASLIGQNVLGRSRSSGNRTGRRERLRQLQDARAAKLSVGGGRSDDEGFSREEPGGKLRVDSEGVKAQAVSAIENGTLANYLIGRVPIRDFLLPTVTGAPRRDPFPAEPGCTAGEKL